MSSVTLSPGTMAGDATVGTAAWTNPDNAKVSDNVYATVTGASNFYSHYLKATNFGFSIPTGATINGILVEVEKLRSGTTVTNNFVRIVKSNGSIGTTDLASQNNSNWPTTETYVVSGGATNLWGETWSPSDINSSNFGYAIASVGNAATASVDHIRITVYYTEVIGGTTTGIQSITGVQSITF